MAIAHLTPMLADARRHGYALCYCESWNLESLQAVIEAAEECRSPIIAGFNGAFLRHQRRPAPERLAYYAGFREALEKATVPVAFLLNESDSLDQIREAIDLGFNSVMPENEGLAPEVYEQFVRDVVAVARPRKVWVEAQLGTLPCGGNHSNGHGSVTDPEAAREFAHRLGIDALAISIGNVHILTEGKAALNLNALRAIAGRIDLPLVVHGGTSLTADDLRAAISFGVAKVNFGTVLKQAYLEAVRRALDAYRRPASPHEFLGIGGPEDIMVAGREAVKNEVLRLIEICGSKNREAYDFSKTI